jgi:hypothetical protein
MADAVKIFFNQSAGVLWMSDQLVAQTSTWQHTTLTTDTQPPVEFEPTISAGKRPQSYALRPRGHWDRHNVYVSYTN